jgi:hypothetical protein
MRISNLKISEINRYNMFLLIFGLLVFSLCFAQEKNIVEPAEVRVYDTPNDGGKNLTLEWGIIPADTNIDLPFLRYEIFRSENPDGPFENVGFSLRGADRYSDQSVNDNIKYYYYVQAVYPDTVGKSIIIGPGIARAQWFNTARFNVLIITIILCFLVIWYIERAKKGEKLFIRRIAGLDAIDDAVGRATELGRPILFSFGLGVITDVVTIAALSILGKIGKKSAEYQTRLLVPNNDPIVMAAAQETVKQSYVEAGRPDMYNENNIPFLTSDQFGYAAGVDGIMLREKPGAVFWMGYFYAESLIMAETGHSIGAIQIAGTTAVTQLPFFIAACDYTLIGEEMYAASCYLKPDPQMLGSLKGEDASKAIIIGVFIIAITLATAGFFLVKPLPIINNIFNMIVNWFTAK